MLIDKFDIFYAYADQDERLRKKLEKHLSLLKRQGLLTTWSFQDISVGTFIFFTSKIS